MQSQKANWTQYATFAIVVVLALTFLFNVGNVLRVQDTSDLPVFPTAEAIATAVSAGIVLPEVIQPEFPDYILSEDEFEENLMEKEAERLVMDELDSKDFRELLKDKINLGIVGIDSDDQDDNEQYGLKIDSYRDIEDVYSIDMEDAVINVDEETGEVEVEFKVKYVLDDDEDLVGKARVTITYDVDELVIDDELEDAEVDEDFVLEDIYLYRNLV